MDFKSIRNLGPLMWVLYFAVFFVVYFLIGKLGILQRTTKYFLKRNYNIEPVIRFVVDIISFVIAAIVSILIASALLKMGFSRKLLRLLLNYEL